MWRSLFLLMKNCVCQNGVLNLPHLENYHPYHHEKPRNYQRR
jgi:hypothetical protein